MRWSKFFRRSRWDAERSAEIDAYLTAETDDNLARGMTPEQARLAAARKFGSATQVREEIYRMNSIGWLETGARDAAYAFRGLRKSPGFTVVAVVSLALGIGATTAIFSLMDMLMLRSLPIPHPGRLVQLAMLSTEPSGDRKPAQPFTSFSYPVIEAFRAGSGRVLADVCVFAGAGGMAVTLGGRQETAVVELVGESFFDLLEVRPFIGRNFGSDGAPASAVISYRYWQRRFGSDPNVLGTTLQIRGVSFPIVAVGPPSFSGVGVDAVADVWIPFTAVSRPDQLRGPQAHSIWWLRAIARLKPGVQPNTAAAALRVLSAQILEHEEELTRARDLEHRVSEAEHRSRRSRELLLMPAGRGVSTLRRLYSEPLTILMTVALLVLLIACANIANLLLARGETRDREMAVRLAIGASRGRLLGQLLTENLVLATLGAAVGLLFASWAGRALMTMVLGNSPGLQFRIDLRVLAFTAVATVATGLLFGLGPALRSVRRSVVPKRSRRASPMANILVIAQAGLSLVLLLGAFLFLSTLDRLIHQDLGFQPESLLIAWVDRNQVEDARLLAAHEQLMDRLAELPGVVSATLSNAPLFGSENWSNPLFPADTPGARINAVIGVVAPNYFEVMRMPLVLGRSFTVRDDAVAPKVAVINEALARKLFPGERAVGRRFSWRPDGGAEIEVAGVVGDFRYASLREPPPPFVYIPMLQPKTAPSYAQRPLRTAAFAVRFRGEPAAVAEGMRREIRASNGTLRMIGSEKELIENTLKQERLLAKISSFFGLTGLLLAAVGLYGLMAYTVGRRIGEMGIRMALGARPVTLVEMVLRESLVLVLAGVALGTAATFGVTGLTEKFLYGVKGNDPVMITLAAATLITVAVLAALIPALRAARVNPMIALRHE